MKGVLQIFCTVSAQLYKLFTKRLITDFVERVQWDFVGCAKNKDSGGQGPCRHRARSIFYFQNETKSIQFSVCNVLKTNRPVRVRQRIYYNVIYRYKIVIFYRIQSLHRLYNIRL